MPNKTSNLPMVMSNACWAIGGTSRGSGPLCPRPFCPHWRQLLAGEFLERVGTDSALAGLDGRLELPGFWWTTWTTGHSRLSVRLLCSVWPSSSARRITTPWHGARMSSMSSFSSSCVDRDDLFLKLLLGLLSKPWIVHQLTLFVSLPPIFFLCNMM